MILSLIPVFLHLEIRHQSRLELDVGAIPRDPKPPPKRTRCVWSATEIKILSDLYKSATWVGLQQALPGKELKQIKDKVHNLRLRK